MNVHALLCFVLLYVMLVCLYQCMLIVFYILICFSCYFLVVEEDREGGIVQVRSDAG